ncbi:MAG: SsrA-binding protein SmpB [Sphingomonadales bacterium]|jgi:SsrA-binding protein
MARPQRSKAGTKVKILAENRKARHEYFLQDTIEAGIALTGTEVKSLRFGSANIAESYAEPKNGEIHLVNAHIPEFKQGNRHNHEPRRVRKLLLHKREIAKLSGAVQRQGMTIVPLCLYFNDRGKVKLEIALAKGKKAHDKRETIKQRDWQRQKSRLMKDHG